MRHRSITNSKPHENLPLRSQYKFSQPQCELSYWLSRNRPELGLRRSEPVHDIHHIFGGPRKVDQVVNLIAVCRKAHDWCGLDMTDQRVLCLSVKLRKGELDQDEFTDVTGFLLPGWLDGHVPCCQKLLCLHAELSAFCLNERNKE